MSIEELSQPNWVEQLVRILKWTYGALWTVGTDSGPAEWNDGWYNLGASVGVSSHDSREPSPKIEAIFYSTYKACLFARAPGYGYVGQVLSERQDAWLSGSEEIHRNAIHAQAAFLKSAQIQTVVCVHRHNHVLELGTIEQVSKNDVVLQLQIQRLLSYVPFPLCPQQTVAEVIDGTSQDLMQTQMPSTPTFASEPFTHNYDVDVPNEMVFNLTEGKSHAPNVSAYDPTHEAIKNTLVTQSYSGLQLQQEVQPETFHRPNQDILAKRVSTTLPSGRANLKMDDHIVVTKSITEEWRVPDSASYFPVNDQATAVDPVICIGMQLTENLMPPMVVSSMPILPIDGFSGHQSSQLGNRTGMDFDHDAVSSLASLSGAVLSTDIPMIQNRETFTLHGSISSTVTDSEMTVTGNNWLDIEGDRINVGKDPSIAEMFEGYSVHESQNIQPPLQQFQAVVADQHDGSNNWPHLKDNFAAAQTHQHHSQFQYGPLGGYLDFEATARSRTSTVHPVQQLHPHNQTLLPVRANMQQQQSTLQGSADHDQHELRSSFTTPNSWVPWTRRAAPRQYKPQSSGSNQVVAGQKQLKEILLNILPRIAQEQQKAREQEENMTTDDYGSSGGRAAQAPENYSTPPISTKTEPVMQDPQARTHMLAERRRRVRENEHYAALRALIPPTSRMDKSTVLGETIQLVKRLKKRVRHLEKVNPPQAPVDDCCNPNPSAFSTSISDYSPIAGGAAASQGSQRRDDPTEHRPDAAAATTQAPNGVSNLGGEESVKDECTSHIDPNAAAGPVPAKVATQRTTQPVKEENDQREIVEVNLLTAGDESPNQLRIILRTSNHAPDTLIRILICFNELRLHITNTQITIHSNWIHANFHLQINESQSLRSSQLCAEVQAALKTAIAQDPGNCNTESHSDAPSNSQSK